MKLPMAPPVPGFSCRAVAPGCAGRSLAHAVRSAASVRVVAAAVWRVLGCSCVAQLQRQCYAVLALSIESGCLCSGACDCALKCWLVMAVVPSHLLEPMTQSCHVFLRSHAA